MQVHKMYYLCAYPAIAIGSWKMLQKAYLNIYDSYSYIS